MYCQVKKGEVNRAIFENFKNRKIIIILGPILIFLKKEERAFCIDRIGTSTGE